MGAEITRARNLGRIRVDISTLPLREAESSTRAWRIVRHPSPRNRASATEGTIQVPFKRSQLARLVVRYLAWRKRRRVSVLGLTLIEMLIAIMIIGVLLSIAPPFVQDALEKARVAHAIGDIRAIQTEINTFEADGMGLPLSLEDIGRDDMEDPWGADYIYLNFGRDACLSRRGGVPAGARMDRFLVPVNCTYDLYSMGKDGATARAFTAARAKDDVVRANDGGYIGLAEKY